MRLQERTHDRIETASLTIIVLALAVLVGLTFLAWGCVEKPPNLSPEATTAFYASRVVKALDVFRDSAIAMNETTPPSISTESTREIVRWHRATVQVVQVTPSGWRPTVLSGIWALTCYAPAAPSYPAPPCQPTLKSTDVAKLVPYLAVAVVILQEVQ